MTIWKPILAPGKALTPYGKDILPITVLNGAIAPSYAVLGGNLHIGYANYSGSTTSITIDKATYEQGILFLCRNGGTPSIFAYSRTNVYTVYEGGIPLNSVSIDGSGTKIIVNKDAASLLYVSIIRLF